VAKLNAAGTALVYSTYLGGSSGDEGFAVAADSSGNAYVTGLTTSSDFPGTGSSPIQSANGGGGFDAFVAKLNAAGDALIYSTYLGGSGGDAGLAIAVDSSGNAYVTGETDSTNFPGASSSPIQSTNGGGEDAFVAKISAGTVGPGPTISSISPDSGTQGQTISDFIATGSNLDPAATLSFSGTGIAVNSYSARTSTQIVASVAIATAALTGLRDVSVVNPDGQQATLSRSFSLLSPTAAIIPPTPVGVTGTTTDQQVTSHDPVSTGNGNYHFERTDFVVPGRGLPLVFQRTYNTLDNYSGPLGANWTHTYNIILFESQTGDVFTKWGDGHGETFALISGNYVPQQGVFDTLAKNPDGSFVLTRKDQSKSRLSKLGFGILKQKKG